MNNAFFIFAFHLHLWTSCPEVSLIIFIISISTITILRITTTPPIRPPTIQFSASIPIPVSYTHLDVYKRQAMSCLTPCDFAPGLSFPYPSRRLITPHTATPAPIAVTTVFNPVTADVKNAIFSYLVLSENLFFAKNKEHCFLSAKLLYLWTSCPNVPIQLYPGKSPRIQRLHLPLSFL